MVETEAIDDEEVILRRIPPGSVWQAPGPRITSNNFKPRQHLAETEISVSRRSITSPEQLLASTPVGAITAMGPLTQWRIGQALAGDVRNLGFQVVPDKTDADSGHALIQSNRRSLDDQQARRELAKLFEFTPAEDEPLTE